MNKKITIAIVLVILAISALVFWNMMKSKSERSNDVSPVSQNLPDIKKAVAVSDADIKSIESDLSSIGEGDFEVEGLSDKNLGL